MASRNFSACSTPRSIAGSVSHASLALVVLSQPVEGEPQGETGLEKQGIRLQCVPALLYGPGIFLVEEAGAVVPVIREVGFEEIDPLVGFAAYGTPFNAAGFVGPISKGRRHGKDTGSP